MSNEQTQNNLNRLLLYASLRSKQGLMKLAEEYDLTIVQTFTLCLIDADKPVPMNSISGLLNCDASNVTGVVDRLVAGEYMTRTESKEDRRVKAVALTEKGLKLRDELLQRTAEAQIPGLATLTKEEAQTLERLLDKMLTGEPAKKL